MPGDVQEEVIKAYAEEERENRAIPYIYSKKDPDGSFFFAGKPRVDQNENPTTT